LASSEADKFRLCAFALYWRSEESSAKARWQNLFPSISARHDVVDGTGKLNPRRS
jgi:hypothetical protein